VLATSRAAATVEARQNAATGGVLGELRRRHLDPARIACQLRQRSGSFKAAYAGMTRIPGRQVRSFGRDGRPRRRRRGGRAGPGSVGMSAEGGRWQIGFGRPG